MNWRLVFLLSLLAVPGPIAIAWLALPLLVDTNNLPVPLETLQIVTAAQSVVLILFAAAMGSLLSFKVGLRAPAISAILTRGNVYDALRPQLLPGVIGGVIGALVILGFHAFAPADLAAIQSKSSIPLIARVLYGGITEEVLVRWGLMTFFVWGGWRLLQRGNGVPSANVIWIAIWISALLFGISHVPSVAAAMVTIPGAVVAYITVGNAMFGVVAGYLFWRYGLEAAVTAHILAHIVAYTIRG